MFYKGHDENGSQTEMHQFRVFAYIMKAMVVDQSTKATQSR